MRKRDLSTPLQAILGPRSVLELENCSFQAHQKRKMFSLGTRGNLAGWDYFRMMS